jgi:hypothetical protein
VYKIAGFDSLPYPLLAVQFIVKMTLYKRHGSMVPQQGYARRDTALPLIKHVLSVTALQIDLVTKRSSEER